jgi:hypothetical protein
MTVLSCLVKGLETIPNLASVAVQIDQHEEVAEQPRGNVEGGDLSWAAEVGECRRVGLAGEEGGAGEVAGVEGGGGCASRSTRRRRPYSSRLFFSSERKRRPTAPARGRRSCPPEVLPW